MLAANDNLIQSLLPVFLVAGVALAVTGMYRMLMAVLSESQRSTDEGKKQ